MAFDGHQSTFANSLFSTYQRQVNYIFWVIVMIFLYDVAYLQQLLLFMVYDRAILG